jgi:dolichol-phosphate mannosyltransferase subunit 3
MFLTQHALYSHLALISLSTDPYTEICQYDACSSDDLLRPAGDFGTCSSKCVCFDQDTPLTGEPITDLLMLFDQAYLLLALPLLTENSPVPSILPTKIQVEIIPVIPFWAVVSLGAYLLGRLGLGVLTFNDTKEAHEELVAQIEKAKQDLAGRGVGTD